MERRVRHVWIAIVLSAVATPLFACARGSEPAAERTGTSVAPAPALTPASSTAPLRAPDVPYEPSPVHVVREIVRVARLVPDDVVYDLGCGDGRIVIEAVKRPGVRGVCVDIDPERIAESRENARVAGVSDRIRFLTRDLFETDIRDATVVTLFLWPKINLKLRPKLHAELRPGTRVISYMHDMGDWPPDETVPIHSGTRDTVIYLWKIPAWR